MMMTHEMETVRFWEHVTDADRWYTAVLVINGLFYFYFLLVEIVQWHQLGSRKYWFDALNIVQMFNVLFFVIHVSLRYVVIDVVPDPIVVESSDFYELNPAVRMNKVAVATMAVNVFLNWFKLIAYLSLNPTFAMMANTLSRAAGGCCGFFGIFCIILYGFAQSHAMVFQGRVYAFRTVGQTTFALLRSLLGDFDFAQLQESHAFMGPFFFISFVLIAVFVVLNMCVCFRPTHAAGGSASARARAELLCLSCRAPSHTHRHRCPPPGLSRLSPTHTTTVIESSATHRVWPCCARAPCTSWTYSSHCPSLGAISRQRGRRCSMPRRWWCGRLAVCSGR
jgi:hypothetical protein